jgi:hypothetical protein
MYDGKVTELTNMTNAYNAKVAELAASQQALSEMTASRDYWQHTVAHNDPNVWDNRYNAGYSAGQTAGYTAGAASKTTTAQSVGFSGSVSGGMTGNLASLSAPRAGLAHISAYAVFGNDSGGPDAHLHIFKNGSEVFGGPNAAGSWNGLLATHGNVQVGAGDTISVRANGDPGATFSGGSLLLTVGSQ